MEEPKKEDKKENNDAEEIENTPNKLKVCCLTWNMHGLMPTQELITALLGPHKHFDIYAIGSEECLRSIFKSLFYSDKTTWETNLKTYFGPDYYLIASETLCAIHLVIFIRSSLIKDVSKVKTNTVKTGAKTPLRLTPF